MGLFRPGHREKRRPEHGVPASGLGPLQENRCSPHQKLLHSLLQPLHCQGEHGELPADGIIGPGPVLPPSGPVAGIEPHDMGIFPRIKAVETMTAGMH